MVRICPPMSRRSGCLVASAHGSLAGRATDTADQSIAAAATPLAERDIIDYETRSPKSASGLVVARQRRAGVSCAGRQREVTMRLRGRHLSVHNAYMDALASSKPLASSREAFVASSATVLRVSGELAGEAHVLDVARTYTAWINGFVSMELAGAFRLGGEVDQAFEFGIE